MILIVKLSLIVLLSAVGASNPSHDEVSSVANFKFVVVSNVTFHDNNMRYIHDSNSSTCAAACLANAECVAYVMKKGDGDNECWLKNGLR